MGKHHRIYDTWQELIEAKTHVEGDCIIWDAGTHKQGYPMVRWDLNMVQVVRKQMEEKIGKKLDGRNQRVKNRVCNNVLCVNPDHYIVADYGTMDWNCVNHIAYSEQDCEDIYRMYDEYSSSKGTKYGYQKDIIKKYPGISRTTIAKIVKKHQKILDTHE